jgi:hypothetical protein
LHFSKLNILALYYVIIEIRLNSIVLFHLFIIIVFVIVLTNTFCIFRFDCFFTNGCFPFYSSTLIFLVQKFTLFSSFIPFSIQITHSSISSPFFPLSLATPLTRSFCVRFINCSVSAFKSNPVEGS